MSEFATSLANADSWLQGGENFRLSLEWEDGSEQKWACKIIGNVNKVLLIIRTVIKKYF